MTGPDEVSLAVQALKAGAVDFIEKPLPAHLLVDAVLFALQGRQENDAETAKIIERIASLTPPEREVMQALVNGNREIAGKRERSRASSWEGDGKNARPHHLPLGSCGRHDRPRSYHENQDKSSTGSKRLLIRSVHNLEMVDLDQGGHVAAALVEAMWNFLR